MNTPPPLYNIDAEEAVIGSLMIDSGLFRKVPSLTAEMFYRDKHKWLFAAMTDLFNAGEPCDPITLGSELERNGKLSNVGGPAEVSAFLLKVPTGWNVEHYAKLVKEHWVRRGIAASTEQVIKLAYDLERDLPEVCGEVEQVTNRATRSGNSGTVSATAYEGAEDVISHLDDIHAGRVEPSFPMALPKMHRVLGGWLQREQTVLAARTGKGKTHFGVFESVNLARQGYHVLYFSLEMFLDAITVRFMSCIGEIDNQQLRFGFRKHDMNLDELTGRRMYPFRRESRDALMADARRAKEELRDLPITIVAPKRDKNTGRVVMPDFTPYGIRAAVMEHADKYPLSVWVLDNLPLVSLDNQIRNSAERANALGVASMLFRYTAIATDTHNLLIHQPKRNAGEEMTHDDLGESKKIADNADNAIMLDTGKGLKDRIMRVSKYRNGESTEIGGIQMEGAVGWFTDDESRRLADDEIDF